MDRIEMLKNYIAVSPHDSFLQHALALEFIKRGEDLEAEKLFRRLLSYEPGYIGSYYHLAKLQERIGQQENAMVTYQQGMERAKQAGDQHAYNELQAAYEDLVY